MSERIYHILNGDSLKEKFPAKKITGEIIVMRECLIDGPVGNDNLKDFFRERSAYIQKEFNEDEKDYYDKVGGEFKKFEAIPEGSEINLWFEDDLFCQVNMWFLLSMLKDRELKVYRVFPSLKEKKDHWKGFGTDGEAELIDSFKNRIEFKEKDIILGSALWNAYRKNMNDYLEKLSHSESECFRLLPEVCKAQIERSFGRPEKILNEIIKEGKSKFEDIFEDFFKREGVYGFGDEQVKKLLSSEL